MKYQLYLINTKANAIIFILMMRKTRHLSNDIPQSYVCSIIPTHSIATSTEIDQFNVWSRVFRHVYKTVGFEWCFGKRFTLASPYAPLVGFTVRTWSRTQFKSRWGKKHRNGRVLYLKLTRQLSLFLKIFRVVLFKLTRRLLQWKKKR